MWIVRIFAIVSLIVAFFVGHFSVDDRYLPLLSDAYPDAVITEVTDTGGEPPTYQILAKGAKESETVVIGRASGFSGPLIAAVILNTENGRADVKKVRLLSTKDTPGYVKLLSSSLFLDRFSSRSLTADFIYGEDIDALSGATITSRAVTQSVRNAAHATATRQLGLPATWKSEGWSFRIVDGLLAGLILLVFYSTFVRNNLARKIGDLVPYLSLGFVGFYLNASLSIGAMGGVVMGYFPDPKANPAWWLITGSVLMTVFLLGHNIYCHKLCPFYTVEVLLNKIGGFKFAVDQRYARHVKQVIFFLVWLALMLIFLSRHPAYGSYEPFSMAFSLNGVGMQWYILPLTLFGSLFVPSFWCRYFCPVGHSLNSMVRWRALAINGIKSIGKSEINPRAQLKSRGTASSLKRVAAPMKKRSRRGSGFFTGLTLFTLAAVLGFFAQSVLSTVEDGVFDRAYSSFVNALD